MNADEWRLSFEIAWDDPWFRSQSIATIAGCMTGILLFLMRLIPAGLRDGVVVFHYNAYLGIDEVHHWMWSIIFSLILFFIVILDIALAIHLFRKDRVASRVLLVTSTLFTAISLIGGFFITSVNL